MPEEPKPEDSKFEILRMDAGSSPRVVTGMAYVSKSLGRTGPELPIASFMRRATNDMEDHYNRIHERSKQDPGTAGDEGECNWKKLLETWLPSEYIVETKGRIVFPDGSSSPQVDVVVLSPCYPAKLMESKQYLAGGVVAAFECKLTLTAKDIVDTREKCQEIKRLSSNWGGTPYRELHSRISYGLLAHSHSWKNDGSQPLANVWGGLDEAMLEIEHPREMLDWVCVADLGCWIANKGLWLGGGATPNITKYVNLGDGHAKSGEVTEEEWLADKPQVKQRLIELSKKMDEEFSRPRIDASYFGLSGVSPIGCFIVSLLYRCGWGNPRVRNIVTDMFNSGLIRGGRGTPRSWPIDLLPLEVLSKLRKEPHCSHWDEWSTSFLSID